jgi:hypothetical protein
MSAALAALQASTAKNTALRPYQVTIARPVLFWGVCRFVQATASRIPPGRTTIRPVRTQPPVFTLFHHPKTVRFLNFFRNHHIYKHL